MAHLYKERAMAENKNPKAQEFFVWVKEMAEQFLGHKEQAVSMPNIYSLVYDELSKSNSSPTASSEYLGLVDIYFENGAIFAVLSKGGLLYRMDVQISDTGVVLGVPVQVVTDFIPSAQSLKTTRQADGKYRWFAMPAATAVLNKSGELDSRQLFQSFVTRIENGTSPYPYLTFYHIGERLVFGRADYAAVDGYVYLLSGTWEDTPLANAMRVAIEKNPNYYGISIGYMYDPATKERMQVGDGVIIPVYTDGINTEASILAEIDAACLYTGAYSEGVNRMNKKAKDELLKVVGDDPALVAQVETLATNVDAVNTEIEDKNLIRRNTAIAEPVAEPIAEPIAEPEPVVQEVEMNDEAMGFLAERVATLVASSFTTQLDAAIEKVALEIAGLATQNQSLIDRIAKLEEPLAVSVAQAVADLPRNAKLLVGYRPRQIEQTAEQPDDELTSEDFAQETLASLRAGKEK
jgi:hypothetical protein